MPEAMCPTVGLALPPQDTAHLRVLTDTDLLHAIFQFLDQQELLVAVPLVCKAFAAACSTPGACWRELEVDGLRPGPPLAPGVAEGQLFWSKLAAWVSRRATSMRTLRLHNLRHLLQPLEVAERHAVLASVWVALAPAARLHTLLISHSSIALAPGTVASLAILTGLRHVEVNSASPLAYAELDVLAAALPALEELSVCLLRRCGQHCIFSGTFPARLTSLKHLRALHLEASYSTLNASACTLPDGLGEWGRQMERLHLINLCLEHLPPSLGQLAVLHDLCLGRNRLGLHADALPPELTQLTALSRLELQYNGFEAGPPVLVGQLSALVELNLAGNLWGSAFADMPQQYSQLRQLKYLTLTNCELAALPPMVHGMSQLLLLKLNINKLQTLPGGPYLRSLECVNLAHNRFDAGYPPALAAATNLQRIDFQFRGVHYYDPAQALHEAAAPQELAEAYVPAAQHGVVPTTAVPEGESVAMED